MRYVKMLQERIDTVKRVCPNIRLEFLQSIDFNQMLVNSTFMHLLALTIVLFLPSPKYQELIVIPTFKLDIIALEPGKKAASPSAVGQKERSPKPIAKKVVAKRLPPSKPVAEKSETTRKLLSDLEALRSTVPEKSSRSVIEELDQLARLSPGIHAKKIPPPKPIQEKALGKKKIQKPRELPLETKSAAPPSLTGGLLQDFEKLKMKEVAQLKTIAVERDVNKKKARAEEQELATLAERSLEFKAKKTTNGKSDLLKELDAAMAEDQVALSTIPEKEEQLKSLAPVPEQPVEKPLQPLRDRLGALEKSPVKIEIDMSQDRVALSTIPEKEEPLKSLAPVPEQPVEKPLQPLRDKLGALEKSPVKIEIDMSRDRVASKEFQSGIRTMRAPVLPKSSKTAKPEILAFADHEGSPESDFLSLYIGKIYERVYSKWKTPLGYQKWNESFLIKNLQVDTAFTIYKGGNIDKPIIRKSAGDEDLNSVALRAIYDSAPFPPLPKEWKHSNLPVTMIFRYVPK